jgi:hypothetical protein
LKKQYVDNIFDGVDAYKSLVRASEGNPRDFIRLIANYMKSIELDSGQKVSSRDVTNAVIKHFQNEKLPIIASDRIANDMFDGFFKLVVQKSSKIFAIKSTLARENLSLRELWHYRFVHWVMQGFPYIKDDEPTEYDVYSLDYGKLVAPKLQKGGEERLKQMETAAEAIAPIASILGVPLPLGTIIQTLLKNERVSGTLRRMFGAQQFRRQGVEEGSLEKIGELIEKGCIADQILLSHASPANQAH